MVGVVGLRHLALVKPDGQLSPCTSHPPSPPLPYPPLTCSQLSICTVFSPSTSASWASVTWPWSNQAVSCHPVPPTPHHPPSLHPPPHLQPVVYLYRLQPVDQRVVGLRHLALVKPGGQLSPCTSHPPPPLSHTPPHLQPVVYLYRLQSVDQRVVGLRHLALVKPGGQLSPCTSHPPSPPLHPPPLTCSQLSICTVFSPSTSASWASVTWPWSNQAVSCHPVPPTPHPP